MTRTLQRTATVFVALWVAVLDSPAANACTTILIGRSLTADGSVIHAHNEDMGNEAVGRLWSVAPSTVDDGVLEVPYVELRKTPSLGYWASGNAQGATGLGTAETVRPYDSVLVGLNQAGVAMSCNWAHSKEDNQEGSGIRRYAIRQLLLERATSARHGVKIIGSLIEEFGQADWGGLIYHLSDPQESWVVETTTRNWVARRVRDDEIRVTANRFLIGSDYDLSSPTLVSDAIALGWLPESSDRGWLSASAESKIDFSAVYGRPGKMDQAYDTRREQRAVELLEGKAGVLAPEDLFVVLQDRYEGTEFYTPPQQGPVWREDLDADPSLSRTISTNLGQSTFVAHLRGEMPVNVGALMWYGVATPGYTGYLPLYAAGGSLPEEFSASILESSDDSAWWLFRRLQRQGDQDYKRHYPAIHSFWNGQHAVGLERQRRIEAKALAQHEAGDAAAADRLLGAFTFSQAEHMLLHARRWLQLLSP